MYSLRKEVLGGAKTATACIILADFNLAVSTLIAKPPNLNLRQIFRLYGMYILLTLANTFMSNLEFSAWRQF